MGTRMQDIDAGRSAVEESWFCLRSRGWCSCGVQPCAHVRAAQNPAVGPEAGQSRPFRMGFTAFPHDFTLRPWSRPVSSFATMRI